MQAKYQKYYDALKGKDFSSPIGGYTSAISTSKSKMDSAQSIINSSVWIEKGLEIIKSSVIPSLTTQLQNIESGISALSTVAGKVNELISCLDVIVELDKQLESLGGKWSYTEGGTRTESEVNSHNNQIDEANRKISEQESSADAIIASINGISVSSSASAIAAGFSNIMTELKDSTSLEAKRLAFIGTLNDDSYWTDPNYTKQARALTLFDNTTGEILGEGDSITMKPGETRILTVKLPTDAGKIDQIIRTSAWKPSNSNVVSTLSDVNPDPNVVEYVNFHHNHYPKDTSVLHANYYDWIITANQKGEVQISQTCLFKREEGGPCPKAMVDIHVSVQ